MVGKLLDLGPQEKVEIDESELYLILLQHNEMIYLLIIPCLVFLYYEVNS